MGAYAAGHLRNTCPTDLRDFIRARVRRDLEAGSGTAVATRFPPEPNGYLHIGHAKSICLNFGIAEEFGGKTYLRFDDTNPLAESEEFVNSMAEDVRWLGFNFVGPTFASDYFDQLYAFAEQLIERGKAFVCDLSADEIRATRGTLTSPGTPSPYRNRDLAENLDLFRRMKRGEFADGARVLRAKIDMASPNINLRDPVLYRIRHATHHRTGDKWRIYPMYDFTHCICDALEGISHSLCTLEFEDHRPLYDWVLDNIATNYHPPQIEFSRLALEYTVLSKRHLAALIDGGHVAGWDDPRMPTLAGLRRRGCRPQAIREFCRRIGVTKAAGAVALELLEFCVRQDLEAAAPRGMAVLGPAAGGDHELRRRRRNAHRSVAPATIAARGAGTRVLGQPAHRARGFRRAATAQVAASDAGGMVRLRHGYIIICDEVVKDAAGRVAALRCRHVPESKSGSDTSGLKPKGVIHWVDSATAVPARVRLLERLFAEPNPAGRTLADALNPHSLRTAKALVEPAIARHDDQHFQFERKGYFAKDAVDHRPHAPVFNRTVALRDSYSPRAKAGT